MTIELPDEVCEALRQSPSEVEREVRLAAAIRWHSQGLISQEWAAKVAGLDRTDFLMALAREKVDAFAVDFDQLAREVAPVAERSLAERVGHLRGQLHLQKDASDPWRDKLRERNFRP